MFRSALRRIASGRVADTTTKTVATREAVPDVMVTFGNVPNQMTFLSHPGVMAVCKLLEMKYLVTPRAHLTQENVDAIRDFDAELADKCQIAVDANITANFNEIEHIDKPEFLQKLLQEREVLEQSRLEVLNAPPGVYRVPYAARQWEKPEAPRKWRPETHLTRDILETDPDLIKDVELQSVVADYLAKKKIPMWEDEEALPNPDNNN